MRRIMFCSLCLIFVFASTVFAQDKMVITFRDGHVQTYDTDDILKIEFKSSSAPKPVAVPAPISKPADHPAAGIVSLQSFNFQNHYIRHKDYLGEITPITSDLDKRDSAFKIVPGLADSRYISFESVNHPGYYFRHSGFRLRLQKSDGSAQFKKDATFKKVPGRANASWSSFEALSQPSFYIRHSHFHLYIDNAKDALAAKDSTFKIKPAE